MGCERRARVGARCKRRRNHLGTGSAPGDPAPFRDELIGSDNQRRLRQQKELLKVEDDRLAYRRLFRRRVRTSEGMAVHMLGRGSGDDWSPVRTRQSTRVTMMQQ